MVHRMLSSRPNSRFSKSLRGLPALLLATCVAGIASGCASLNRTEEGAAAGAILGGVVGGLLDDHTARGAIIGAAIGGTAGAIIGRQMDRHAAELERELEGAEVERIGEGIQVTFASGLLFDFDSDALRPESRADLTDLAQSLVDYDNTDLIVVGHTDATGEDAYNLALSQRRASSAAAHLVADGVRRSRIETEGRGETEPVASNESEAGRQANRRVEVAIFASEAYRRSLMAQGETSGSTGPSLRSRFAFELRGGLNRPLGDNREAGARGDASFGGDVFFGLAPAWEIYAGWARDQFSCEVCGTGEGTDLQGFEAGLQYTAMPGATVRPWIRAGGIYQQAESEFGATLVTSDREFGFQAAGGVRFPLGDVISVSPGLRYQRLSIEGAVGDLSYLVGELGMRFTLPER